MSLSKPLGEVSDESEVMIQIKTVWDEGHGRKCKVKRHDGSLRDGWECPWCLRQFVPVHATRYLHHVLKVPHQGIAICHAVIPANSLQAYWDLYNRNVGRAVARRQANTDVQGYVVNKQDAAVVDLTRQLLGVPGSVVDLTRKRPAM